MRQELNILISGLGGQGVILAARILAQAAFTDGQQALIADVVGASQRFGSAYSFVRIGDEMYSATFPEGEADLLLGFEPLQCLKTGVTFASENGSIIMSDRAIGTQADSTQEYLAISDIIGDFERMGIKDIKHFDAAEIAIREAGNIVALNMVMLGAAFASELIPAKETTFETVIRERSPNGTAKANMKAFRGGREKYKELIRKR